MPMPWGRRPSTAAVTSVGKEGAKDHIDMPNAAFLSGAESYDRSHST
jgi:hypothetical protein